MEGEKKRRGWLNGINSVTIAWAVVEWMLFELRRMPYRPPEDMHTLLGTERVFVVVLMIGLAIAWFVVVYVGWRPQLSPEDARRFNRLLPVLALIFTCLALFPLWPVTPIELFFR